MKNGQRTRGEKPAIVFWPDATGDQASEWDGESREIPGELHLVLSEDVEALDFLAEMIEAFRSHAETIILHGFIQLYGDGKTPPTALHNDGGLLERERKTWLELADDGAAGAPTEMPEQFDCTFRMHRKVTQKEVLLMRDAIRHLQDCGLKVRVLGNDDLRPEATP